MSYCDGLCEFLERDKKHNCAKYKARLGYFSKKGSFSFTAHMMCPMCEKDTWVKNLEGKLKCNHVSDKCLGQSCEKCTIKNNETVERLDLPCTIGDTIHMIHMGSLSTHVIDRISIYEISIRKRTIRFCTVLGWVFFIEDFGKTIFLDREKAEKAFAELLEKYPSKKGE